VPKPSQIAPKIRGSTNPPDHQQNRLFPGISAGK
jgi:hypothetical protein